MIYFSDKHFPCYDFIDLQNIYFCYAIFVIPPSNITVNQKWELIISLDYRYKKLQIFIRQNHSSFYSRNKEILDQEA